MVEEVVEVVVKSDVHSTPTCDDQPRQLARQRSRAQPCVLMTYSSRRPAYFPPLYWPVKTVGAQKQQVVHVHMRSLCPESSLHGLIANCYRNMLLLQRWGVSIEKYGLTQFNLLNAPDRSLAIRSLNMPSLCSLRRLRNSADYRRALKRFLRR